MDKHSWYLFVDLVVLYHASIISNRNRLYLFVFVWISKSCPTLHIHTHMIPHTALPAAAWWHHSAHWVRQNGHWVRLRQEESREWEPMPGGRKGREERERVEMGGMHHLEYSNRSYLMFVYLAIDSLYSSISLSISPSSFYTPPQHALTHTSFQWLSVHPLWSSLLPLTPLLPLSLAFQHKTPDIMWQVSA